jgi:predicted O-methyltransferase YrrM
MKTEKILTEIELLESFSKQGESYTNETGSFGWRNPIRKDTGSILEEITSQAAPKRVLEIGTAHGLSTLYLVCGLNSAQNPTIDTIEFDEQVAEATQERMTKLEVPVRVHHGEAMEVIAGLEGFYDLVFFDAQKNHYYKQLKSLIDHRLIGKGTLVLADNVIDRKTECQPFLDWFTTNEREHRIIPTECGLLIAQL